MELNLGFQNEKPPSPVSKRSPTFLLPGVGYRVTTSVVSEALLNRVTAAASMGLAVTPTSLCEI